MKLQSKVVLITIITWVVICLIVFMDATFIVKRNYAELENELIQDKIEDIKKTYDNMLSKLVLFSQAFSQWDDAYDFMKVKNEKFINSNFVLGTYTSAHIHFMMYFDTHNQLYYGRAFDEAKESLVPLPASLIQYLKNNPQFLSHENTMDNKVGILNSGDGLIVMSSLPVLTSTGLGPSRGSLLMGYYLKESDFNQLSELVGMRLTFFPLSSVSKNALIQSQLNSNQTTFHMTINDKIAHGFILLTDIDNKPIGILRIEMPRHIYLQGLSTRYHYFIIVIILGLLVMLLNWYMLKTFVINRILNISDQVTKTNSDNQFKKIYTISGHDELDTMINSINNMIEIISFSQERLLYLATHDNLTHLPNRKYFNELLSKEIMKAKEHHSKLAILFIDMDKFKNVNDQYGHNVGDQLLQQAVKRIRDCIKDIDILARQSGDEFVACLKDITKIEEVSECARRIIRSTSTPFKINNLDVSVTFSVGISIYPEDGKTVEDLLKNADQAMYQTKEKSGDNYQFFNKNHENAFYLAN